MKRICFGLLSLALLATAAPAQDRATEERLNQLSGKIEDLIAGQEAQRRQIAELTKAVAAMREQQDKPSPEYASQESLKSLADAVREVDRKRLEDYEKIRAELLKLGKTLSAPVPATPKRTAEATRPAPPERGYEYVVQKNDTLSTIIQAYRDKNVKVTLDQVLKANPGLKPEKLRVGQTVFIPEPQS